MTIGVRPSTLATSANLLEPWAPVRSLEILGTAVEDIIVEPSF